MDTPEGENRASHHIEFGCRNHDCPRFALFQTSKSQKLSILLDTAFTRPTLHSWAQTAPDTQQEPAMIDLNLHISRGAPRLVAVILAPSFHGELHRPALMPLDGKPLLAWSLDCAMNSRAVSEVIIVTDDATIAQAASRLGRGPKPVRVLELEGEFSTLRALQRAAESIPNRDANLCALHVAAPFRAGFDVDAAADLFQSALSRRDDARPLSLCSVGHFQRTPTLDRLRWVVRNGNFGGGRENAREGAARYVYAFGEDKPNVPGVELCTLNCAITLLTLDALRQWVADPLEGLPGERLAYLMPEERSLEIESERDLRCARAILGLRNATTVVAPPLAA
jgi:CMP-N-acetylneuraminic acid synthetase